MRIVSPKKARSRGIAALMTTVMILGVMTSVGLAVDVGMMYAIKTKLSAAVDAASLASARGIGAASNGGPSITTVGQAYFAANFPAGYMLSSGASMSNPVTINNADGSQTVSVTATASFPLLFMRFLNNVQTVNVGSASTRRNLNLVMVLDRSSSMNTSGSCVPMVAAAQQFVNNFVAGQDALGLVVFGGSYWNNYAITKNFTSGTTTLAQTIATITCSGNTGTAQALTIAHQMLAALPATQTTGAINGIVFFTDGQPNGLTADWPISTAATPSYPQSSGGNENNTNVGNAVTSPWYLGYAKSGCSATVLKGGIPTITGYVGRSNLHQHGIFTAVSASIGSDGAVVSNSTGCAMASATKDVQGFSGSDRVHEDIAYIPAADTYGNVTTGYWTTAAGTNWTLISNGPYAGQPMLDRFASGTCAQPDGNNEECGLFNNNLDLASMNAAEAAATSARTDPTVPLLIFSIGLGGAADQFPGEFLEHVSNTTTSDQYNSAQPSGQYIYVTGPGQLAGAFSQIASYVLRLSS